MSNPAEDLQVDSLTAERVNANLVQTIGLEVQGDVNAYNIQTGKINAGEVYIDPASTPAADPHQPGRIWMDGDSLKISAG